MKFDFRRILFLILFSSCAMLKTHDLKNEKIENLLDSIKITGDGRGRMSLEQNQFVFRFEALLKQNYDWILAADFPIHGEEVLILNNLKSNTLSEVESDLQKRVEVSLKNYLLKNKKSPALADQFFKEFHFLLQFLQSTKLGITRICEKEIDALHTCQNDGRKYKVEVQQSAVVISRPLSAGFELRVKAENRVKSDFERISINFLSKKEAILGLELFFL